MNELYEKTYIEVVGTATTLDFSALGWGPKEFTVLAEALGSDGAHRCQALAKLRISSAGIKRAYQHNFSCYNVRTVCSRRRVVAPENILSECRLSRRSKATVQKSHSHFIREPMIFVILKPTNFDQTVLS